MSQGQLFSQVDDLEPTRSKRPVGYVVPDPIHEPLFVVTTMTNTHRWKSREKHFERWAKHMHDSGAVMVIMDIAFGDRAHGRDWASRAGHRAKCDFRPDMVYQHQHIKLRTPYMIWLKERGINLAVAHLTRTYPDWKYMAYVDADVTFLNPNWVGDTIHALHGTQKPRVVQMFSQAHDLGPDYEILPHSSGPSFMAQYLKGITPCGPYPEGKKGVTPMGWPGLAWAENRPAWDCTGGLFDPAITGAGDFYMAYCLTGQIESIIGFDGHRDMHEDFRRALLKWQYHAVKGIRKNLGVVPGAIAHNWHGSKKDRGYAGRTVLLPRAQFSPVDDLITDAQGLYQLVDHGDERSIQLRDNIWGWSSIRNEDSIDVR